MTAAGSCHEADGGAYSSSSSEPELESDFDCYEPALSEDDCYAAAVEGRSAAQAPAQQTQQQKVATHYDGRSCRPFYYTVVDAGTARAEANALVDETAELIGQPPEVARCLLRHSRWRATVLMEDWVENPRRLLEAAGLRGLLRQLDTIFPPNYTTTSVPPISAPAISAPSISAAPLSDPPIPPPTNCPTPSPTPVSAPPCEDGAFVDPITCHTVALSATRLLPCGHRFSLDCLRQYVLAALASKAASGLLDLRCIAIDCGYPLPLSVFNEALAGEDLDDRLRSCEEAAAVESMPVLRYCPAEKCFRVIRARFPLDTPFGCSVECSCGHKFCFACTEGDHAPIDCLTARRWNLKNLSEADNVTWILANTKCCPNCKHPIEKNQGCMHMTCRCSYQFCWLCLGNWNDHSKTNYNQCNVYNSQRDADAAAAEHARAQARMSLERYAHFFERYTAHTVGQRVAQQKQLPLVESLVREVGQRFPQLGTADFLAVALDRIIECRRFIKWTYAFAYFADWSRQPAMQSLFEDQQGQLEWAVDRLQELVEYFDLKKVADLNEMSLFRSKLVNLTGVVKDFFDKMEAALRKDYSFAVFDLETDAGQTVAAEQPQPQPADDEAQGDAQPVPC